MRIKLLKLPKHKHFSYQPRYYSEAKEEMDERFLSAELEKKAEEGSLTNEERKIRFKGSFDRVKHTNGDIRRKAEASQRVMVLGLMLVMGGLVYLFLRYGHVISNVLIKLME